MKNNAFLSAVDRRANQIIMETRHVHTQMCLDAAMIAANEVFNMGPSRVEAFCNAFSDALVSIAKMTVSDTPDMEYTKAKLDQRLKQICGDKFQPWEERYK